MALVKVPKAKPSGAQRRKLERERLAAARPPRQVLVTTTGDAKANRLMTVIEWRREIAKVYREMRSGKIRTEEGTRFVYVSEIGARLAKMQEELESIDALRRQLEQVQGGTLPLHNSIDFIPAHPESTGDEE